MIFINQKMTCCFGLCVLMLSAHVAAMQQPQTNPELSPRQEKRRQFFRELQELKKARRAESTPPKAMEQAGREATSTSRREALRSAYELNRGERPAERNLRLSPEERVALRKQIREARIEIYQRRNEKKD